MVAMAIIAVDLMRFQAVSVFTMEISVIFLITVFGGVLQRMIHILLGIGI
jgi:hypothetical protein